MQTTVTVRPMRTGDIGSKLRYGYFPITGTVVVLLWVLVIFAAVGPAAIAAALILAVWSIQICLVNLLMLLLRFTEKELYFGKALLVGLISTALLPLTSFGFNQVKIWKIGEPDLLAHLQKDKTSGCEVVGPKYGERVTNTFWIISAIARCSGDGKPKECRWNFHYKKEDGWVKTGGPWCK